MHLALSARVALTTLTLCACSTLTRSGGDLRLGLYKVVERRCAHPPDVPEDCSSVQYIELVHGSALHMNSDRIALIKWLASEPNARHRFHMRDLIHGELVAGSKYVIENDDSGIAWLTLSNGVVTHYHYLRRAREGPAWTTDLTLAPVTRDEHLSRLLEYPQP